ncbi:hypothetical protein SAMN02746041_02301 [Desulfacinum hydrothermale DSM 13146]|uniref:AB hydrolase-1 domain-containing protein n=1 Tax=Desulfacinum hydrothermale DSM 13146 TaxID=1121390 RepID=A0A1W1XNA0_9BACT|nr:alpha/beta fold hydrolase [Desulfacinum hydrothermale]SMC25354.1 hypothetical protein SAMN02746041_02301 [Desulfacinum hydrothermale DSM 13146]
MPVIHPSSYRPPRLLANPHVQMILANQLRFLPPAVLQRERIHTPDGDFLDLDWSCTGARRAAVICHGLEGHSRRPYVRGMTRALNRAGWDVCAMNYRGCSGEPNRKPQLYHSGATEDLDTVVRHVRAAGTYETLALVGFSLGGNLVLKYLGEQGSHARGWIRGAVAFSAPCDLTASARAISRPENRLYLQRFLKMLRRKIEAKERLYPGLISSDGYDTIRSFQDFDNRYTAPLHGFRDAWDYYRRASSKPLLERIAVPTLIVNAQDDPFLAPDCFPFREAGRNPHLFLEAPERGSHVGFFDANGGGIIWSERRAVAFLSEP